MVEGIFAQRAPPSQDTPYNPLFSPSPFSVLGGRCLVCCSSGVTPFFPPPFRDAWLVLRRSQSPSFLLGGIPPDPQDRDGHDGHGGHDDEGDHKDGRGDSSSDADKLGGDHQAQEEGVDSSDSSDMGPDMGMERAGNLSSVLKEALAATANAAAVGKGMGYSSRKM